MSFVSFVMFLLLGCCSLGRLFVLQSAEKEPAALSGAPVTRTNRCLEQWLQAIRKTLLSGLNLQVEPRLPVGGLTAVREQWKASFPGVTHTSSNKAVSVVKSEGPAVVNSELKCCQMASRVTMKELGWDNWVIYPESFTFIQCSPCNSQLDPSTLSCPSHSPNSQMPCCQPTSQELLPILYMDEQGSVVISSVRLTRTCGCGPTPED